MSDNRLSRESGNPGAQDLDRSPICAGGLGRDTDGSHGTGQLARELRQCDQYRNGELRDVQHFSMPDRQHGIGLSWSHYYYADAMLDQQLCLVSVFRVRYRCLSPWIENAYDYMAGCGQGCWYHDETTNILYYIPRAGENIATVPVVAPRYAHLVIGSGVNGLTSQRITFAYTVDTDASTIQGYVGIQAGYSYAGTAPGNGCDGGSFAATTTHHPSDSPVLFSSSSKNITFDHNLFTHIGGARYLARLQPRTSSSGGLYFNGDFSNGGYSASGNYTVNRLAHGGTGFYSDNGSSHGTWTGKVQDGTQSVYRAGCNFCSSVTFGPGNYHTNASTSFSGNTMITSGSPPPGAVAIINAAGIQSGVTPGL